MKHPFAPFGAAHLGAVAVIAAVLTVAIVWARRVPLARAQRAAHALAWVLAIDYLLDTAVRVAWLDVPFVENLPFHYCGWVHMIAIYALLTCRPAALEVQVILTFAGVLHSLITPTPSDGFPGIDYFRYFIYHGLVVGSAVYSLGALDVRLTWRSAVRAVLVLQAFEAVTGLMDWATGLNFMYLRAPPPSPTLFDAMGAWPWYLLSLEVVGPLSAVLVWLLCARLAPGPRVN
jgi:hypothetical integral membrane protein (TIGR02206 family)